MLIVREIANFHTATILLLIVAICIYVISNFFSKIRTDKLGLITFIVGFIFSCKAITNYSVSGNVFLGYVDIFNVFVVASLFLAPLFWGYGVFSGYKSIKQDITAAVINAKHALILCGIVILMAPLIYIAPEGSIYWPERSFYAACTLLAFFSTLVFLSPLFYAFRESGALYRKEHNLLAKKLFYTSSYLFCLMAITVVLNIVTISFVSASLMAFVGGQR